MHIYHFRYDKQDVSFAKRSLKTKKVYGYKCPVGSIKADRACGKLKDYSKIMNSITLQCYGLLCVYVFMQHTIR